MQDIHELVEVAGAFCEKFRKVKSWEILGGSISGSNIAIEKGFLKTAETSTQYVINIRLFGDQGKTGSVNITKISLPFIQTAIENTVSLMKGSLPNPEFKSLTKPAEKYPNIMTPYDSRIKELDLDDTTDIVDKFLQIKSQDERIVSVSGDFSYSDVYYTILNSNGVNLQDNQSSISLSTEITMEETIKGTKENSNGYEGQSYNYYKNVRPDEIFNSALKKATMGLKKSKIATGDYPVILAPQAVVLLFNRTLSMAINAQSIYEKRSFLRNQIDKKIASDSLEVQDDPWMEGGLATSAWDMEGTPTKPLKLVEKGILNTYLHNSYTANLFETVSTGHGSRGILSSSVGISPSNLRIKPGNDPVETMIESIDKGVLMEASYDSPNYVTGEFSGLIASGYLIENGEIKNALRESLIGLNFLDFYNNISGIGKKVYRRGSHYVPYIKIDNVKVSAKI